MDDILYTVKETSELLKVNTNYVYDLIKKGFLPALKLGSLKIRRTALLEFLEKYEGFNVDAIGQSLEEGREVS